MLLIELALGLVTAGAAAGFLGGLLGAGGGLIVVPMLFHVFSVLGVPEHARMHLTIGTALAAVIPTALVGARAHWQRGNVDVDALRQLVVPMLVGAIVGGVLSPSIDARSLGATFAVVTTAVAAMLLVRSNGRSAMLKLHGLAARGTCVLVGCVSTVLGIGGATLTVPMLNAMRLPMHRSIGTASTLGLAIAIPGAIAFALIPASAAADLPPLTIGHVNLLAVSLVFPASSTAARIGASCTPTVPEAWLKRLFALVLLVGAARMLWKF